MDINCASSMPLEIAFLPGWGLQLSIDIMNYQLLTSCRIILGVSHSSTEVHRLAE